MVAGIGGLKQNRPKKWRPRVFLEIIRFSNRDKEGEALLLYRHPQADFSIYLTVCVKPAIVLMSKKSGVPQEEPSRVVDDLRSKVIWKLKEDFLVVPKFAPDALRIERALTEANPRPSEWILCRPLFCPPAWCRLTTDTRAFVGRASVKAKLTDGNTGPY